MTGLASGPSSAPARCRPLLETRRGNANLTASAFTRRPRLKFAAIALRKFMRLATNSSDQLPDGKPTFSRAVVFGEVSYSSFHVLQSAKDCCAAPARDGAIHRTCRSGTPRAEMTKMVPARRNNPRFAPDCSLIWRRQIREESGRGGWRHLHPRAFGAHPSRLLTIFSAQEGEAAAAWVVAVAPALVRQSFRLLGSWKAAPPEQLRRVRHRKPAPH